MDKHHQGNADDAGDRGDVADKHEIQFGIKRRVDRVRHGGKQQRVSVSRRIDHSFGCDIAVGARPVFGDEGLPEPLGEPLTHQARRDVDPAAGRKSGNDAHRPGRVGGLPEGQACGGR